MLINTQSASNLLGNILLLPLRASERRRAKEGGVFVSESPLQPSPQLGAKAHLFPLSLESDLLIRGPFAVATLGAAEEEARPWGEEHAKRDRKATSSGTAACETAEVEPRLDEAYDEEEADPGANDDWDKHPVTDTVELKVVLVGVITGGKQKTYAFAVVVGVAVLVVTDPESIVVVAGVLVDAPSIIVAGATRIVAKFQSRGARCSVRVAR